MNSSNGEGREKKSALKEILFEQILTLEFFSSSCLCVGETEIIYSNWFGLLQHAIIFRDRNINSQGDTKLK